jgi:hypothetical protein
LGVLHREKFPYSPICPEPSGILLPPRGAILNGRCGAPDIRGEIHGVLATRKGRTWGVV